jgi:transposase-like protein
VSEEPTTAAVQRYLNALAGDAPAEPIVREPPNSASPRYPLTRCTSPPCDRCRDDPTLVCVTLLRSWLRPHRGIPRESLSLYLGFFEFVHNVRARGKRLLGSLIGLLLAPPRNPS